jgi:proteasome lid subunit RPN8/RPN11
MATARIHVAPSKNPGPLQASIPVDLARRWFSPFEQPGFHPRLAVFVTQAAYAQVVAHAASEEDQEVGGLLVGSWCLDTDDARQYLLVETALPARFTRQGKVFLTFTQDSLVDLHAEMEEHHPDRQIVGWYHTHPHMGVFLSHYDTWLHANFFPEPWQVALVIEPQSDIGGFFVRQEDGELDPGRYFGFYEIDGDAVGSVVHWQNMQDEVNTGELKGEDHGE